MTTANTPITVKVDTEHEAFETGTYYAEFVEFDGPIEGELSKYTDGKPSIYYKFSFRGDDGKTHVAIADKPSIGYPKVGKNSNKLGRYLAGLAGKPPTAEFTITPSDYYGKRHILVYGPNKEGNIRLQSFTPTT